MILLNTKFVGLHCPVDMGSANIFTDQPESKYNSLIRGPSRRGKRIQKQLQTFIYLLSKYLQIPTELKHVRNNVHLIVNKKNVDKMVFTRDLLPLYSLVRHWEFFSWFLRQNHVP